MIVKIDLNSILIVMISIGLSLGTPLSLMAQNYDTDTSYRGKTMHDLPLCKKETRIAPPLWVTVTGYDADNDKNAKVNKNYMIGEQKKSTQPYIVPKRSIVQLHPKSQALLEELELYPSKKLSPNTLLGVKVLSLPPDSKKLHENDIEDVKKIASYRDHFKDRNIEPEFAKPGSVGYLKFGDLERAKNQKGYIFMLKRDSPLLKKISEDTGEEDVALELAQENEKYLVNHCCNIDGVCRDFAIYKALHPKTGKEIKTNVSLEAECESCLANESIPMKKDFMKPLQGLVDLFDQKKEDVLSQFNFVDSRGFVQLPVGNNIEKLKINKPEWIKQGPFGSIKYKPEQGNADVYLKPEVACGFTQLLKAWQKKYCPDNQLKCQIHFGDASHALYEGSTLDKRWEHNSHSNGECIDIRPQYTVPAGAGRSFHHSNFDKENFKNFMNLATQLGPDVCYTTHKEINNEFSKNAKCRYDHKHDGHLHICFPRKNGTELNNKLMNACLNGVKI